MKIEFEKKEEKEPECLAYVNASGHLTIWDCDTNEGVVLRYGHAESNVLFTPEHAQHKFYPGDKVTITF